MKMKVTTQILKLREMLISAPPLPINAFILAKNIAEQNNMFVNVMHRFGGSQFLPVLIQGEPIVTDERHCWDRIEFPVNDDLWLNIFEFHPPSEAWSPEDPPKDPYEGMTYEIELKYSGATLTEEFHEILENYPGMVAKVDDFFVACRDKKTAFAFAKVAEDMYYEDAWVRKIKKDKK